MKAIVPPQTSGQNEIYTYIAIPIEALQCSEQGVQTLTVAQNVILKALPDGNISQQIEPPSESIITGLSPRGNKTINTNNVLTNLNLPLSKAPEKRNLLEDFVRPTVIEQNRNKQLSSHAILRKSVILKSERNKVQSDSFNKPGIRYLKIKSIQNRAGTRSRDKETGSFKCTLCGQVLDKIMTYRRHMEMHRNTKKFKCEQCSASYNIEDNLKIHMAMHSKSEPTCPICNRKFQRLASLKAHIIIHEVEETFTCVECLAEYEKEEDFNRHMESHEKEKGSEKSDNLPLVCSICSHVFSDPNQYKEHISYHIKIKKLIMNGKKQKRRVHSNREYTHKCEVCKKTFSKYCLLERHMRIHSGEKPFACHLCKRAFTQKGTLQIHLARHSGIKPFHCTLCPAKFCQKGNLRVHVQKTHVVPNSGEKVYKCTMCTCIFKRVSSLNAHITRAHAGDKRVDDITDILEQLKELEKQLVPRTIEQKPEVETNFVARKEDPPPSDVNGVTVKYVKLVDSSVEGTLRRYLVKSRKVGEHQWYICTFCSKEFKKPSDLIRHFRVHTREKPFKCKQCDQAFSLKSTLATHISTHIGKRQYQCIVCLKMFTSIRTLNTHLRRHDKSSSKRSQHYMCSTCNKVFNSVSKAKIHMEMHKSSTGQALLSKGTEIEVVMQQPMVETANGLFPIAPPKSKIYTNELDSTKPRPHKCNYCYAAFTKAVHLKRHMLIHSGERERRFKCDICTKSFYSSYALKEHLKFHSGERNFNCKSCGKRFVTNAILKRHLTIHSSFRPYVCPYCRKRFKTVLLCRKHINIHKRDLDMEIHALKETGELDGLEVTNGTATVTDLNDPLADNPFPSSLADNDCSLGDLTGDSTDSGADVSRKLILTENSIISAKSKLLHSKMLQQDKNNAVSKILFTDTENGIIISTPMENQAEDSNNELNNSLNQHMYQANPPDYVDRPTNLSLLSDSTGVLGNVEDAITTLAQENVVDTNDSGYPTVYINCDDLQSFTTASLYNACLAQLKNNDPLLLSGINEIQDPNLLFATDPTLNQLTDTQLDSQNLETLIPTFTFSTNLALNNLSLSTNSLNTSFPNIILSNVEETNDINQLSMFPSIAEVNKKSQVSLSNYNNVLAANSDGQKSSVLNLDDDSITELNQEGAILSNLLYNSNQLDVGLNATSDSSKIVFDGIDCIDQSDSLISPNSIYSKTEIACSSCHQTFKGLYSFKNHSCDSKTSSKKTKRKRRLQPCARKQDDADKPASDSPWNVDILEPSSITESNQQEYSVLGSVILSNESESGADHKCADCGKLVANKNALARHMLIHKERKSSANICSYCSKLFKKRSDLERHIRTHTGEKPFSCDKCEKSFSLKSTLESHYRTHNPGGNKDFSCAVCSSYFSSKSSLRVHMLMHMGVKPYQCTMCPEKFRTSGHRKSHMANHLKKSETKKNSQSKNAKVNSLLASVIMDSQNSEPNKTENISELNEAQSNPTKQTSQLIVQEPDKDLLYQNQTIQVDPIFLQQLQLSNVLLQDGTDELPSYIQVDINNDGQITNVKPIATNVVNSINSFDQSPYFEATVTDKHGVKSNVGVIRNFECDVCHKKYSTRSVLTKHRKIHATKNLFNCTKCDIGFAAEGELENHFKLHSGYRPFCCQLCANTFSQEKNLKTHMKRIHGTTS